MTDHSASVQRPGLAGIAPTYVTAGAADFFTADANSKYLIHYKNGATSTGGSLPFKVTDPTTPTPPGSSPAAGFADAVTLPTGMLGTTEAMVYIENSNRFRDGNGRINLVHGGTITTVTLAIQKLA